MSVNDNNKSRLSDSALANTPGHLLSQRRQSQGLSIQDVAAVLKMSENKLKSIEENDFSVFVAETYTKGYLKNYARFLKLDEGEVIASYSVYMKRDGDNDPHVDEASSQDANEPPSRAKWWWPYSALAAVLVIWLAGYYWFNYSTTPTSEVENAYPIANEQAIDEALAAAAEDGFSADVATASTVDSTTNTNVPLTGPAAGTTSNTAPAPSAAETVSNDTAGTSEPVVAVSMSSSTTAPVSSITSTVPEREVESTTGDQLSFQFAQDCWVKVVDAKGSVLAAKLLRSGQQLSLSGNAPFTITLGNVRGVSLAFNDKPFVLTPERDKNTLRFTVGG